VGLVLQDTPIIGRGTMHPRHGYLQTPLGPVKSEEELEDLVVVGHDTGGEEHAQGRRDGVVEAH